jgi:hypothetical protein
MPHDEKTYDRSLAPSLFHRYPSMMRFGVSEEDAKKCFMVDMDHVFIESEDRSSRVLFSYESAKGINNENKICSVHRNIAQMAGIESYLVLYQESKDPSPFAKDGTKDIELFKIKRLTPTESPFKIATPKQYVHWVIETRNRIIQELNQLPLKLKEISLGEYKHVNSQDIYNIKIARAHIDRAQKEVMIKESALKALSSQTIPQSSS